MTAGEFGRSKRFRRAETAAAGSGSETGGNGLELNAVSIGQAGETAVATSDGDVAQTGASD